MKLTVLGERHRFRFAPIHTAPTATTVRILFHLNAVIVSSVISATFDNGGVVSFSSSSSSSTTVRPPPLIRLILLVLERADAVPPVVLPVLRLEILHQRPVVVPVALGELLEVVRSAAEELRAREVGGAREGLVLR